MEVPDRLARRLFQCAACMEGDYAFDASINEKRGRSRTYDQEIAECRELKEIAASALRAGGGSPDCQSTSCREGTYTPGNESAKRAPKRSKGTRRARSKAAEKKK